MTSISGELGLELCHLLLLILQLVALRWTLWKQREIEVTVRLHSVMREPFQVSRSDGQSVKHGDDFYASKASVNNGPWIDLDTIFAGKPPPDEEEN